MQDLMIFCTGVVLGTVERAGDISVGTEECKSQTVCGLREE